MTNEELEKLRNISIRTILGKRDNGRDLTICCPVHSDRTASFILYCDNHYHCFGCGIHGYGAIDFLVALGATFQEAVSELSTETYLHY